ncbi:MFS transporter [Atopomonas sediminilitoris]|uniref:MFS transporter n=1 Tax=Atopomonas sediminilitoris TaxID=2919919 RepID=UPI001F4F0190|nr:MFS transporter [Atopomonas sediminilitoris]MCJ8168548.1 MFS transporter [Atopomonas sediminilitoris]
MSSAVPYWRLSNFYFWYFSLLGASAPFWPLFLEKLGLSPARIGELIAIPMLMRVLAPNLWAALADSRGTRLGILRLGSVCTLVFFAGVFIDQSFWVLALVMALHSFFWHAILPQAEVITLHHLGTRTDHYSKVRLWGSVGFIAVVVGFGWLFERLPVLYLPHLMALIMLMIILAGFFLPALQVGEVSTPLARGTLRGLLKQPTMLAFFAGCLLMLASHGPYYTFFSVYLQGLGYSRVAIGLLWALGVLAEIIVFLLMARVIPKLGLRWVLVGSLMLATLRWVMIALWADNLWLLLLAQCLHAATFGAFHAAAVAFIQQHFPPQRQSTGQALYSTLGGAGGALGALLSGYAWGSLGASQTYMGAAALALLGAWLAWRWLHPQSITCKESP